MIINLFSTPTDTGFLFYPDWHLLYWGRNDDIIGEDIEDINVPFAQQLIITSTHQNGKPIPPLYMRRSDRRRRRHWQGIGFIPNLQGHQSAHRRPHRIQTAAQETGAAGYYTLDTGDIDTIPSFITKITTDHPDLDCLINNAGVQRPLEINKLPAYEFLSKADQEININIRGPMHLALSLLEHFRTKPRAAIINVSSVLGFVPFSIINPVYNGTKAWVHCWTTNLCTLD